MLDVDVAVALALDVAVDFAVALEVDLLLVIAVAVGFFVGVGEAFLVAAWTGEENKTAITKVATNRFILDPI